MTFFVKKKTTVQNTSIKSYQYVPFMTFLLIKQSKKDVSVTCKLSETRGGSYISENHKVHKILVSPFRSKKVQRNAVKHVQT